MRWRCDQNKSSAVRIRKAVKLARFYVGTQKLKEAETQGSCRVENSFVRGSKGAFVQLGAREPVAWEFAGSCCHFGSPRCKCDAVAGDGVFNGAKRLGSGDVQFQFQCCDALRLGVGRCDFDIWEFPEVTVDDAVRALTDKEFAVALDDEGDEMARGGGCMWRIPSRGL